MTFISHFFILIILAANSLSSPSIPKQLDLTGLKLNIEDHTVEIEGKLTDTQWGAVFVTKETTYNQAYVLKVFRPDAEADLEHERSILKRLGYLIPYTQVSIYKQTAKTIPWDHIILSRYFNGVPFSQFFEMHGGRLNYLDYFVIRVEMENQLHLLKRKLIEHRRINDRNVIVDYTHGGFKVKIINFAAARLLDDESPKQQKEAFQRDKDAILALLKQLEDKIKEHDESEDDFTVVEIHSQQEDPWLSKSL